MRTKPGRRCEQCLKKEGRELIDMMLPTHPTVEFVGGSTGCQRARAPSHGHAAAFCSAKRSRSRLFTGARPDEVGRWSPPRSTNIGSHGCWTAMRRKEAARVRVGSWNPASPFPHGKCQCTNAVMVIVTRRLDFVRLSCHAACESCMPVMRRARFDKREAFQMLTQHATDVEGVTGGFFPDCPAASPTAS